MASTPSIEAIAGGVIVSAILYLAQGQLLNWWRHNVTTTCPQYPHWDPLTGYDFRKAEAQAIAAGRKNAWHRENFAKYGKNYQVIYWGQKQIHTMDVTTIQAVLTDKTASFGVGPSRGANAVPWLGKGQLTTDGEFWQHSRDLVKPVFNRAQVSNLSRLDRHLRNLIRCISGDGGTVDLQELFGRMCLDFATDFMFGESSNTLDSTAQRVNAARFIESFDKSLQAVVYAQSAPRLVRILTGKQRTWDEPFRLSQSYVDGYIEAAVRRRRTQEKPLSAATESEFVFLEELLREAGTDDRLFLRGQIMNVFYPSGDTSASGISLVFFQLARHPKVWARIRGEVLSTQLPLTYDVVKGLQYTSAAVFEALRVLSPGSSPVRTALRDCEVAHSGDGGPFLVTKGTKIIMHTHAIQRDPAVWGDDAEPYRPERWLEGDAKIQQRRAWEYLPFSGGPRICPAAQMMNTHLIYIVAVLAAEFEQLQNRDPVQQFVEEHRVSLKSRNGVKVRLVKS